MTDLVSMGRRTTSRESAAHVACIVVCMILELKCMRYASGLNIDG